MTEERKWRSFKYNLNKKDRKLFDEMFANSLMSIIFHHYKQIIQLTQQTGVRAGKLSNATQWDELVN